MQVVNFSAIVNSL